MRKLQERFIDRDFWYNFESGPREVRSIDDAKKYGNNCVALAHLVFAHMHGITLPPDMHCYEWYANTELFPSVSLQDMQPGALVWFAPHRPPHETRHFVPQYKITFSKITSKVRRATWRRTLATIRQANRSYYTPAAGPALMLFGRLNSLARLDYMPASPVFARPTWIK